MTSSTGIRNHEMALGGVQTRGPGLRVRIKSGPLRGVEGWVEQRFGRSTVLLRLDFISQAAGVKLDGDLLEPT